MFGEKLNERGAVGDLAARFGQRFALLGGHQPGKRFGIFDDQVEPAAQDGGTLFRQQVAPRTECAMCRFDRDAGAFRPDIGHAGDFGASRRVQNRILGLAGPGAINVALLADERVDLLVHRRLLLVCALPGLFIMMGSALGLGNRQDTVPCALSLTSYSAGRAKKSEPTMRDMTVIFDLDGTMVDTAPDLIAATNHTLGQFGMAPVEARIIQPALSLGAKAMIHAAMNELGRVADEDMLSVMTERFVEYYSDNIAVSSRIFPGLVEALVILRDEGARLGVCTNKRGALTLKLLAELQLDRYFHAIAGADMFPVRKPDARHLLGTIAMAGGDLSRAVMIGDSATDAGAARNAKVPFVAVSFGYGESPVEDLKPDAVIHSFADLLPALRALLPARKRPDLDGADAPA